MKGKAQTVLGEVDPHELGVCLPHEHLEVDVSKVMSQPPLERLEMKSCEFTLRNSAWIRQYPYSHDMNVKVYGEDIRKALMHEMVTFKANGGGCLVENSTRCLDVAGDRVKFALDVAKKTGLHIILGTGYYVNASQSEANLSLKEEEMCTKMTRDLTEGCEGNPSVKCGILGEIGCSWPHTDFEKKSLRASAAVAAATGCPVMIHPGRNPKAPEEAVRVFTEAGGSASRITMAHLDRTFYTEEDLLEFAKMGTFLEYDLFGLEVSYYQQQEEVSMPSDAQRIERIKKLIGEGYSDKVLASQDIHTRHRLEFFGGHGFSHIVRHVAPVMKIKGIREADVNRILKTNPANWLTFAK